MFIYPKTYAKVSAESVIRIPDTLLVSTMNNYFENNSVHEFRKNFFISLIPKNSKSKFRPISLVSCILQLIERMINTRLHLLEKNKLIPETQNGFRKANSCQHALTQMISDIHLANNNSPNTCCALIDIKSAFDDVFPFILNQILLR